MNNELKKDYDNSVNFWNQSMASNPEDYDGEINQDEDWKEIGSASLCKLMSEAVKGWDNVLDYGCGSGWADVLLAKNGVRKIKAVDVAENAVASAGYYAKAFESEEYIDFEAVSVDWLANQAPETYDHAINCNVLDVVPDEIAEGIIEGLAKVCKKNATLLITMNPYFGDAYRNREGFDFRDNYLYVNNVLRVNNHTDEEWTTMLSKYFTVDNLKHFRWDVEQADSRRLFYLTKK